jgi:hypothetical protein
MEFSKLFSDILFLKGVTSGISTVTVRINEPGYDHVVPATVKLTITEPFIIIPSQIVYLLPTSAY